MSGNVFNSIHALSYISLPTTYEVETIVDPIL